MCEPESPHSGVYSVQQDPMKGNHLYVISIMGFYPSQCDLQVFPVGKCIEEWMLCVCATNLKKLGLTTKMPTVSFIG